ncbi:MAG TPA: type II toxin-antitoxin system VapC family toxin [Pirellulaceae bacterium]|nr:type II toxin-antitoxin system VapC family toxin [Pirellulaceae bacterium]
MILLDTDHLTVLRHSNHPQYASFAAKLQSSRDPLIAATVISLEEQMRGWLAEIARRKKAPEQVPIYLKLTEMIDFYQEWETAAFTQAAADIFMDLRKKKVRIGTQDLKIASIALASGALLLSANLVDFQKVPGLRVEDWLYPSSS